MWLTHIGYCLSYGLVHYFSKKKRSGIIMNRTLSTWFILAIVCICQFGSCHAQKDTGEGTKVAPNTAFHSAQKGSELGEAPPARNPAPARAAAGNVRAVQGQAAAPEDGDESAQVAAGSSPIDNLPPPVRPAAGGGGGLTGVGAAANPNPDGSVVIGGRAPTAVITPIPIDQEQEREQPQDGPPQPQAQSPRPRVHPQAQSPLPRGKAPRTGKARGGANVPVTGEEITNAPLTTPEVAIGDEGSAETADGAVPISANPSVSTPATINIGGRPGNSAGANKGKVPKSRPVNFASNNGNIGNVEPNGGESNVDNGNGGPVRIGEPNPGSVDAPAAAGTPRPKPGAIVTPVSNPEEGSDVESTNAPPVVGSLPKGASRLRVGGGAVIPNPNANSNQDEGGAQSTVPESPSPRPRFSAGPAVVVGGTGEEDGEQGEFVTTRGPPGIRPNTPPLPSTGGGPIGNRRNPNGDLGARNPQLAARSPGAPSPPPIGQADPTPRARGGSTAVPIGRAGAGAAAAAAAAAGGGAQSAETEETGASSALIQSVNDEYVEVVKNLTEAGVLTEADYESKPVSDLFAILLEKLINANPGATEEDQHRLVHQAGIEFVEVFKANAANTKNVSEIVRLVTEQLQAAPIVLNEGQGEPGVVPGSPAGSNPSNEPSTSAINPVDSTSPVRFGASGRTGTKNTQTNLDTTTVSNSSSQPSSNHTGVQTTTRGQLLGQAPSATPIGGTTRKPLPGEVVQTSETNLPGPPAGEGELVEQTDSTLSPILGGTNGKTTTTKSGVALPFGGTGTGPLSPGLLQGSSSPSPVPLFGSQNVPGSSRVPGFSNINGQFTATRENNETSSENSTSSESTSAEELQTTTEGIPEGPVAVVPVGGNPRFPFPAQAPSTLRPPLRFFTTSSTVGTTVELGGAPLGPNRDPTGFETQSPFVVTAAPPSFVPFGRNPASAIPPDGQVGFGGTQSSVDPSLASPTGSGFPVPPTWSFPSDPTATGSSGETDSSFGTDGSGSVELNEGTKTATISPFETGIFGVAPNGTAVPGLAFPPPGGLEPSVFGSPIGTNSTLSPFLSTTTVDDFEAPFTHDINSNSPTSFPVVSNGFGSIQTTTRSPFGSGNVSNSTDGEFFGSGIQSNTNLGSSTPLSFGENSTESGEAFVTESGEANETLSSGSGSGSGEISTSSEDTSSGSTPLLIPGIESGIPRLANVSSNGSTSAATPPPFPLIPGVSLETTSGPETTIDSTFSSGSGEINETSAEVSSGVSSSSTSGGGLIVGSDTSNSSDLSTESTIGGLSGITGLSSESTSASTLGPLFPALDNETSTSTTSGFDSSTTEELETESGSGSGDENENGTSITDFTSTSSTSGSGGPDIFLPTRPIGDGNTTGVPGEVETTSGSSTGTSSNPMVIWNFRIVDPQTVWDSELLNKESFQFKELHSSLISDLKTLFKTLEPTRFVDVTIKRFSMGSVIVDGQTEMTERVDSAVLLENFVKLVAEHKNMIGGRAVETNSIKFDGHESAPQTGTSGGTATAGGTPNWVIALVVAVILVALIIIALVVVIKRRKRQASRDNYMVDEETMSGQPKPWPPRNGQAPGNGQAPTSAAAGGQRGANGLSNGRDQYSGVNMYEMKEPAAPNAHMNYGYQPDRPANGHGRSVTEIHINESNVDNEATSKH